MKVVFEEEGKDGKGRKKRQVNKIIKEIRNIIVRKFPYTNYLKFPALHESLLGLSLF